jgi:hypothetical protein
LLVDLLCWTVYHVNTDTQHHMTDVGRVTNQLQQDPGNLAPLYQDIVRPFEAPSPGPKPAGYASQPGQLPGSAFKLTHATLNPQHQAEVEIFSKRTHPLPPATTATGSLALGKHQE